MDVCVESEILPPTLESLRADVAGQAGDRPADASDTALPQTPQPESAAVKKPWSAWAWLGLCKAPSRKIPNIVCVEVDAFFAAVEPAALAHFHLDFPGPARLYPEYQTTLRHLQAEIFGRTGLGVSLGAART